MYVLHPSVKRRPGGVPMAAIDPYVADYRAAGVAFPDCTSEDGNIEVTARRTPHVMGAVDVDVVSRSLSAATNEPI